MLCFEKETFHLPLLFLVLREKLLHPVVDLFGIRMGHLCSLLFDSLGLPLLVLFVLLFFSLGYRALLWRVL